MPRTFVQWVHCILCKTAEIKGKMGLHNDFERSIDEICKFLLRSLVWIHFFATGNTTVIYTYKKNIASIFRKH